VNPEQHLKSNGLWDLPKLKEYAQANSVYVIESPRFPGLAMLHYMDSFPRNNLWNDFALMSRGLLLDIQNKKVLHWGYNKFFNLGQHDETKYDILKNKGPFECSEKLDGSLILVMQDPNTGKFHCLTKGSLNSLHGLYATHIMPEVLKDEKLINKYSLILELIAPQFQIVVNYARKGYNYGLYLTGAREKATNRLLTYAEVTQLAKELGLPCIKTYAFESLDHLIKESQHLSILDEGFVLRWEPELLVKIKGPKYLEMHRFISNLSDRNILQAVANNTDKDLLSVCPDEFINEVSANISRFKNRVAELTNICYNYHEVAPKETRKEYALWVNQNVEPYLKGFLFQLFDQKPLDRKNLCKVIETIDHVDGKTKI
jgi:RNA ligase